MGLVATLPPGTRAVDVGGFDGVATLRAAATLPLKAVQPREEGMTVDARVLRAARGREGEAGARGRP